MKYAFVYCFMLLATLLYGGIPYASAQESYTASLEETGDNIQNAEDYLKSKSQSLEKYLHRSARIQKRLLKKMKVTESGMAAKLMKTDSVLYLEYAKHPMAYDSLAALSPDSTHYNKGSPKSDPKHLIANEPQRRIGTAIMLKAMPGDRFDISADGFYQGEYRGGETVKANSLVESLLSTMMGGQVYSGVPISELPKNAQTIQQTLGNPAFAGQLTNLLNNTDDPTKPKAHLNYLFFNSKFELVNEISGAIQIPMDGDWVPMEANNLIFPLDEPGYVFVYIDNQSIGTDAWFDNVHIEHYTSSVLEENHYYPFGLTITGEAGGNTTGQPYKYQGIELEQHFGLETYETFYRGLDPQIGRFNQIDPKAERNYSNSPFASMNNNPVIYSDPLGDENTIYMINLPNSGISDKEFMKLQKSLNSKMKEFNLDITYTVFKGDAKDFKKENTAGTDGISVFGKPKDVTNYIDNTLKMDFVNDWGGSGNPGTTVLNVSGIDGEGVRELAENNNADFNTAATFITLHESGHPGRDRYGNIGSNDHTSDMKNALSWRGQFANEYLKGSDPKYNSFNALMDKSNNSGYIKSTQRYFNAGYSQDNYSIRAQYPFYRYVPIPASMSTFLKQP